MTPATDPCPSCELHDPKEPCCMEPTAEDVALWEEGP